MDLYIIGNGFDRKNGYNSNFEDFQKWLSNNKSVDDNIAKDFILKLYKDSLWSEFENNICNIKDFCSYLYPLLKSLDKNLSTLFSKWSSRLVNDGHKKIDFLAKDFIVMSFNYTRTVLFDYGLKENINYFPIHGICPEYREQVTNNIVIGHGDFYNCDLVPETYRNVPEYCYFVQQMRKPVEKIVKCEQFQRILAFKKYERIVFFGFSFGNADLYYVKYLIENLDCKNTKFIIYLFKPQEIKDKTPLIEQLFLDHQYEIKDSSLEEEMTI